ncbi:hypothetical protein AAF712_009629 [Marasmius tenuissimus]|uniref:Uncharacterized protein n=1 Tax=Marasmius tenuissimus TaxID=585030 RepID=A0ABR2ZQB0_9AGAR
MAFKNTLSRFLLAIWNTLIALFTLKQTRPYHSDDGKLEIVVHSPIVPEDASLSKCTGTASASSLLFSVFTKAHERKGTSLEDEDDPLDESQTVAIKSQEKKKFKKHTRTGARSDIPPPKIYVQDWSSLPFDVSNLYEPSKPDLDSWRPELLPDSCLASSSLPVPTSQLDEFSQSSKDAAHSTSILKTTTSDEQCPSPKPNDSITDVHPIDSLPPIQLFSNDNYSFASSDSAYSSASPTQLLTSPAPSYIPHALSAILYDTPISSTLPSPMSICYKQTLARKNSQTQCSTVECTSTSLFPSEPNSSVTTLGHEVSRTPYPDLFDFGMYVDVFGSASGLASFGSVVAGEGLSISGLEEDMDKPTPRRYGVMFGTSLLGNTPSSRSPPLSKDVYRSAAYSKPVGPKKVVVGLGLGIGLGLEGDGMRKAVLRGVVRKSVSVSGSKMSPSTSSPILGRATSFDRGVRATSSVEEGLSVDAIEERLRDASWDKSMFDWSEAEFLEMLRYSP